MTLLEKVKRIGKYTAAMVCDNCGFSNEVKIPKGIKVSEFAESGKCKCDNCGCIFKPNEYKTKWLKN